MTILGKSRRVELNGHDFSHILSVSIDSMEKEEEEFNVIEDSFNHYVEYEDFASGSIGLKDQYRTGAEPTTFLDALGFAMGHTEYDATNDIIKHVDDNLSAAGELTTGDGSAPQRIVELRNITGGNTIDRTSDGGTTNPALGQSFIAPGEDINSLIRLKFKTTTGNVAESFDVAIHSDNSGSPAATALSGSSTVTWSNATQTWSESAVTWEVDTTDILGSATLTIGTTYWLVIDNIQTVSGDVVSFSYSTSDDYSGGTLKKNSNFGGGGNWVVTNLTDAILDFVIQFKTNTGLQLTIYDYTDTAQTTGIKYQFDSVKIMSDSGAQMEPKKVTEGTLKWASRSVTISTI